MLKRTIQGVFLSSLALFSVAALAQPRSALKLNGPAEAMGDGVTPIQVQVDLGTGGSGELDALRVDVSAGRFASKKELSTGLVELTVVPPRVVEEVVLTIAIHSLHGSHGKAQIRLLPAIAPATVRVSNGPLDLQVPSRLILGHDQQGTVSFRSSSLSPVTLYASAGTISSPTLVAGSRYTAVYSPPAEKLPRVVLVVAATEDGSIVDFAPIQLYGRPLVATTSEPHVTVLTRVAGEVYGPFQADRRGHVELRVLAPPGVSVAQTVAQDALHNERAVTLKLGVSPVHEAFAICPAASEALFFFAVDAEGSPRKSLTIRVDSTLGRLSSPQLTDGGYYSSPLTLPPDVTLGQSARLTAQIEGEPDSRVACDLAVAGEAPVRLQLSVAPDIWVVDSERSPRVHVQAIYEGKRTPRAVTLLGSTDVGELTPFEPHAIESSTATWILPANLGGRRQAKLQVQTAGPRPVKSELVIQLQPGVPASAKITAQPGHLKSDGRSEAQLVVEVRDAHGNPVDVAPEVVASRGTVSRFTAVSSGVFAATYRAPQSSSLAHDDVRIRVGNTNTVASVQVDLTPTSDRWRLWGTLGYSTNFAKVHGPTATAGGGVRLPVLRERVIVGADVGYYGRQTSELDATREEVVSIKTTVVPVTARAIYELRLSDFSPYLGVGGGIGMVRLDISSPSTGNFTQWKGRPLLSGLVGTLWRLGPGSALVEVMYRAVSVNELAVSGNVAGLATTAGYLYEF